MPKNDLPGRLVAAVIAAILLAGCGSSAGTVHGDATAPTVAVSLATKTVAQVTAPGLVRGQVDLCGGPTALPCHLFTGRVSGCEGKLCSRLDAVMAVAPGADTAVTAPLSRGRFSFSLAPGTYTIKLLEVVTSRGREHGQERVSQTQPATVAAGQTAKVVFKLDAG